MSYICVKYAKHRLETRVTPSAIRPLQASLSPAVQLWLPHHRQRQTFFLPDFFPPAAQFPDRVWGFDVHFLVAELGLAALNFVSKLADFLKQAVQHLVLGDGGDLL